VLAERAAEAMQRQRFKEAIEAYKQILRQDPQPAWQEALAAAYRARAGELAAKGMFKEAAMVFENTLAPGGILQDPLPYLKCLIRNGQQEKAAAHALLYAGRTGRPASADQAALEELAAALLVAVPPRVNRTPSLPVEQARWLELAEACREALAAWSNGAAAEEVERHLNRISLRSPFRPLRLLLKSLLTATEAPDLVRRQLESIRPGSPFFPFRQAVEALLPAGRQLDADDWNRLTPAQQGFVAEARGLPASRTDVLTRLSRAERGGPGMLFDTLLKLPDLPRAEVRDACLNLLAQAADRQGQFEKAFGPLPLAERQRLGALAAEAAGNWGKAERGWRGAAEALVHEPGGLPADLARGVIFRHLAVLALKHEEITGDSPFGDARGDYLERSIEADPGYLPATLDLITHYRSEDRTAEWHRAADEALRRFPDDPQVLLQAMEAAVDRKAYKKASGFARRVLQIDPINVRVRKEMVDLQLAHARKQVRAKRADLATKELAAAAEWERPDAPSAPLRIARALVAQQAGSPEQVDALLREGVELAGGGVAGWFRAVLEAELMKLPASGSELLRQELERARRTPPSRAAVLAIVSALSQPEAVESRKTVAGLLLGMRAWLQQVADLDWSVAEFQAIAEMLMRFEAYDLLEDYARAALRREPANPEARVFAIMARTRGEPARLSMAETDTLDDIARAAMARGDAQAVRRIDRFLACIDGAPGKRRRPMRGSAPMPEDLTELMPAIEMLVGGMPDDMLDDVRAMVGDLGRTGAVDRMVERFRASPLGRGVPEAALRDLAESIVAQAVDVRAPSRAGRRRGAGGLI
jgi:tetratricopeptide (TPR) repeat protein